MGWSLEFMEDLLEIFLNFLAVLCLETALDALVTGASTPAVWLWAPFGAALLLYLVRRTVGNLPLFLLAHAGIVWGLFSLGKETPLPLLWQIAFAVLGVIYAVHSLKIRLAGQRDGDGEIPPAAAAVLAVAASFVCGYAGQEKGTARIIGLCFLWLCGYLLKKYFGNFQAYVGMSRRGTGAMPEKSIFSAGMRLVLVYIAGSILLLFVLTRTPLLDRIAEATGTLAGECLRLFLGLLISLIGEGEGEETVQQAQGAGPDFAGMIQRTQPPVWLEVLEKILTTAAALAMVAGAVALIVLFVRFLIRAFYGREGKKKEFVREGVVEEEEFLGLSGEKRGRRLLPVGGTSDIRVRRIFFKTAVSVCGKDGAARLRRSTARELIDLAPEGAKEEWKSLAALYERARYSRERITREDVREAGKLSRRILHIIR